MVGPVVSPLANDRLLDPIVARIVAQLPTSVTADIARARIDHEIARIPAGTVEVIAATTPASAARLRQEMSVLDGIGRDAPVITPRYLAMVNGPLLVALRTPSEGTPIDLADPATVEWLAPRLSELVDWLARLPADAALASGVRLRTASYHNFARCLRDAAILYADVAPILDAPARASYEELFSAGLPRPEHEQAVVHPAMTGASLSRVDDQLAVGGWGDLGLGDRIVSLVRPWLAGGAQLVDRLRAHLSWVTPVRHDNVRFLARCAAMFDLASARRRGDGPALMTALAAIRRL